MLLVFSLLITDTEKCLKVISPVSPLWAAQIVPTLGPTSLQQRL